MFSVYLRLGIDHILNVNAYDHIIFLVALCAMYAATDWKRILILVTAFTIGHSITLALSSLDIISVNADLVELLIPITILITATSEFCSETKSRTTLASELFPCFIFWIYSWNGIFKLLQSPFRERSQHHHTTFWIQSRG